MMETSHIPSLDQQQFSPSQGPIGPPSTLPQPLMGYYSMSDAPHLNPRPYSALISGTTDKLQYYPTHNSTEIQEDHLGHQNQQTTESTSTIIPQSKRQKTVMDTHHDQSTLTYDMQDQTHTATSQSIMEDVNIDKQPQVEHDSPDYIHFAPPKAFPISSRSYDSTKPPETTTSNERKTSIHISDESSTTGSNSASYSRKNKALGLLAQRVVNMYEQQLSASGNELESSTIPLLSIDRTASHFLVERRRIYDIINILEALKVVSKKGKNVYYWNGLKVLDTTFQDLQTYAIQCEEFRIDAERNYDGIITPTTSSDDKQLSNNLDPTGSYFALPVKKSPRLDDESHSKNKNVSGATSRKKEASPTKYSFGSLGQLTKKFVSLYLVGYDALSLGEATERLLGNAEEESNDESYASTSKTNRKHDTDVKGWKTKVRRLYDIANVLCSIDIIDKTSSPLSHKKCGNMLTNDGKSVHIHKTNQYFYWKYPKTPKDMLVEKVNSNSCASLSQELNTDRNKNVKNVLGGHVDQCPLDQVHPTDEKQLEQFEASLGEKDETNIGHDIYEI